MANFSTLKLWSKVLLRLNLKECSAFERGW